MVFRNILVRATNWVGDAVMSVPALAALRDRFPMARITIVARPWVAALYESEPFCNELLCYDLPGGARGILSKWKFARTLSERDFDCAIVLPNSFESALIAWLARIPLRIGYARDGRSLLLTHPVRLPSPGEVPRHERFYYLELLRRAGLINAYTPDNPVRFVKTERAAGSGRLRFEKAGLALPVIGVSPGAAFGGAKRWLPERFAEAACAIAAARNASIALFGSKQEAGICERVRDEIAVRGGRCLNFAGQTTLGEFIEMAAACEVYLSNDSGPMHIASAMGVPTVAIFGATDDQATGPTGPRTRVVRQPVHCSPCLLRECPIDHRCMTAVNSDRVVEAAFSLLK
jgi:heptosyltransferase-2